ncbi:cytochrome P450 [Streptomyces clavuligerus]|uniref:cytochrome P450 n=1 Tax=Streptomyces clavuligerus TaxID=1901 RepID=UPI001F07F316|nr:cytochrome P450 [Streptomyces clavuligerus]
MPEESGPRLVAACLDLMKGTETRGGQQRLRRGQPAGPGAPTNGNSPGRDFADSLITHGSRFTRTRSCTICAWCSCAANETTVNLVANTLRLLLTDRRFRASLSAGQMTCPTPWSRVLWDAPPVSVIPGRWATGDTVLGGQHIKAGDMLLLGLAAGNTDPRIRPDRAAPVHGNRFPTVAFSSGPHECPGRDIGRGHRGGGHRHPAHTLLPGLELSVPAARTVHPPPLDDRAGDRRLPRTVTPPPGPFDALPVPSATGWAPTRARGTAAPWPRAVAEPETRADGHRPAQPGGPSLFRLTPRKRTGR